MLIVTGKILKRVLSHPSIPPSHQELPFLQRHSSKRLRLSHRPNPIQPQDKLLAYLLSASTLLPNSLANIYRATKE